MKRSSTSSFGSSGNIVDPSVASSLPTSETAQDDEFMWILDMPDDLHTRILEGELFSTFAEERSDREGYFGVRIGDDDCYGLLLRGRCTLVSNQRNTCLGNTSLKLEVFSSVESREVRYSELLLCRSWKMEYDPFLQDGLLFCEEEDVSASASEGGCPRNDTSARQDMNELKNPDVVDEMLFCMKQRFIPLMDICVDPAILASELAKRSSSSKVTMSRVARSQKKCNEIELSFANAYDFKTFLESSELGKMLNASSGSNV